MITIARAAQLGAVLALGAFALVVAGCSDDAAVEPSVTVEPSPTASASPTDVPTAVSTVTANPTATATDEPVDPLLPPSGQTGLADVDRVIGAILEFSGDYSGLDALVRYTETECTLQLGGGGPPKCWDVPGAAQVEGTPVVVFPFSVCEGEWEPRSESLQRILAMLVEPPDASAAVAGDARIEVYGVYSVPVLAEQSDWPAGDYAVVFATLADGGLRGTTVRVADGGIVSIQLGCGPVFPAAMAAAFADQLLEPPLAGLELAGDGVIATVEELPLRDVEETAPRWEVVIDLAVPVGGYRAVLITDLTVLQRPDGGAASAVDLVAGETVAVSGVPLPWSLWQAEQVIVGG